MIVASLKPHSGNSKIFYCKLRSSIPPTKFAQRMLLDFTALKKDVLTCRVDTVDVCFIVQKCVRFYRTPVAT